MHLENNFDWIIIGGGIHGVHIAASILDKYKDSDPKLGIIDPWPHLLHRWYSHTAATGMSYLRSPAVHNLAIDPFDLQKYGGKKARYKQVYFRQPYSRPSTNFFKKHSELVIDRFKLKDLHVQAKVEKIVLGNDHVEINCEHGQNLSSQKIVLALGSGDHLNKPDWAATVPNTEHIFSENFLWPEKGENRNLVIVGGGISAIQAALYAYTIGFKVHLVTRHELRQFQFDSDPGWLGPKYMAGFLKQKSYEVRRKMISHARHRGSAPQELIASLRKHIADKKINFHHSDVRQAIVNGNEVTVELANDTKIEADMVLLATGFKRERPGGKLVANLLSEYQLPTASCDYPILDAQLRWHPRLFVSGALAELELGPAARNISGARSAARRIVGKRA
ncbi:MAG: SidA/IucD/PvdA family monooxygenase [Oligoflexales bacterium]|nr:SidA/IucD/PvdA family monooxygenase [Oligoflexales bacterium]